MTKTIEGFLEAAFQNRVDIMFSETCKKLESIPDSLREDGFVENHLIPVSNAFWDEFLATEKIFRVLAIRMPDISHDVGLLSKSECRRSLKKYFRPFFPDRYANRGLSRDPKK
jgi:hypothetical protein